MASRSRSLALWLLPTLSTLAGAASMAMACGGSSDGPAPFQGSGTGDAAARPPDGASSSGDDDASVTPLEGEHTAGFSFATSKGDTPEKQQVFATVASGFAASTPVAGAAGCQQVSLALGLGAQDGGAPNIATGEVTASVGGSAPFPVLVNQAGTSYPETTVPWTPGTDLVGTMAGAPAGVPAFTMGTKAPERLELVAPAMPGTSINDVLQHPRASDLVVRWTGGAGAVARVSLSSVVQGKILMVSCDAPAETGELTVSAAVFALFDASTFFSLDSSIRAERREGDWLFHVQASSVGLTSDGRAASCMLGLQ